jgi:hypothetical protein
MAGLEIPWLELSGMGLISFIIVYLGVASPLREIHRLSIPDVLQPRFLSNGEREVAIAQKGFGWLIPPMLATAWIGMRPFMKSWLSVVYFFLFEAAFVGFWQSRHCGGCRCCVARSGFWRRYFAP